MTLYDISEFSPYEGVLIPLNVTLTLKEIVLKVQDRKIKEIQTGECRDGLPPPLILDQRQLLSLSFRSMNLYLQSWDYYIMVRSYYGSGEFEIKADLKE